MTRYLTAAIPLLGRDRGNLPPRRQGPDGTGRDALDSPGAQALLNLRCIALNDEWKPFMNHHIQRETARLYANVRSNPIHPASPRRLTQGRARLVTPNS